MRKLKRGHGNLLGGRAIRYKLFPLCFTEIPNFDLSIALNRGLIPRYYQSDVYKRLFQSYVGDYLKEEIIAKALTRNIPAFSRLLEIAALSNGEQLNYQKIASDCGISAPTVKEYYQILIDTLIGSFMYHHTEKNLNKGLSKLRSFISLIKERLYNRWNLGPQL